MSLVKKLSKNSIFYGMSLFLRFTTNALVFFYMANKLVVEDFGRITLANTFGKLMVVIVAFGFPLLMTRQTAVNKKESPKYMINILSLMVILSFISITTTNILTHILKYDPTTSTIVKIFLLYHIFNIMGLLLVSAFRGIMEFKYELLSSFAPDILLAIGTFYLVRTGHNLLTISYAFLATRILFFSIALALFLKIIGKPSKKDIDVAFCKYLLKESAPFALWAVMSIVYTQMGTVILSYYSGERSVGIFQGAFKVIMAAMFLSQILIDILYPYLSERFAVGNDAFKKALLVVNNLLLVVLLPLMGFIFIYSSEIMKLIYFKSPAISSGGYLLAILAVGYFFYFAPPYALGFAAMKKQKVNLWVSIITTVVNITANFILISKYNALGACIATLLSYATMRMGYVYFYLKYKLPFFSQEALLEAIIPLLALSVAHTLNAPLPLGILILSLFILRIAVIFYKKYGKVE